MHLLTLCQCSFASSAKARISWLEGIVCQHVPGFDLNSGPKVDLGYVNPISGDAEQSLEPIIPDASGAQGLTTMTAPPLSTSSESTLLERPQQRSSLKRSFSFGGESEKERPSRDEVHSVAVDLGLLSLNVDSRHSHYLGSSSGILFTRLIEAEYKTSTKSEIDSEMETATGDKQLHRRARPIKKKYQSLYEKLRKVFGCGL